MAARKNIKVGQKFGKLTIIKEVEPNVTPCGTIQRKFLCKCECGNEVVRFLSTLSKGAKASCGCTSYHIGDLNKKYTTGQAKSFIYNTWSAMKQRCYDKNCENYHRYGGIGITICDEWLSDYLSFYNWSINNGAMKGLSIDRIDVNGNYNPSNCRWTDAKTQARNKTTTRYITYNGETKSLSEWAEYVAINADTIRTRLDCYGYTIEEALGFKEHLIIMPKRPHCRKHILQFTLDNQFVKEWNSVSEIHELLGLGEQGIRMCCYGKYKHSGGYIWRYKE